MDLRLVQRAQQGDEVAFERLTLELYARLHAIAHGILRDATLAEDAIQQAVMTVWRELPRLREPARFEAWSYRILVNACHAEGRSLQRWISGVEERLVDRTVDETGTQAVLDRDQLERAFRGLSVDHRAVVVLRYYLDMPPLAVAETLEIPVGTVHSRLHHAMDALRASIAADERRPTRTQAPPETRA